MTMDDAMYNGCTDWITQCQNLVERAYL